MQIITISNYSGDSREYIKRLIQATGATFTPSMSTQNTVLVAAHLGGTKTDKASTWGISVVNHTWLEDCFDSWQNITCAKEKYVCFPPGYDFTSNLGERGYTLLEEDEKDDLDEEDEIAGAILDPPATAPPPDECLPNPGATVHQNNLNGKEQNDVIDLDEPPVSAVATVSNAARRRKRPKSTSPHHHDRNVDSDVEILDAPPQGHRPLSEARVNTSPPKASVAAVTSENDVQSAMAQSDSSDDEIPGLLLANRKRRLRTAPRKPHSSPPKVTAPLSLSMIEDESLYHPKPVRARQDSPENRYADKRRPQEKSHSQKQSREHGDLGQEHEQPVRSRRTAATRATERLETIMPDVINFQREVRNQSRRSSSKRASVARSVGSDSDSVPSKGKQRAATTTDSDAENVNATAKPKRALKSKGKRKSVETDSDQGGSGRDPKYVRVHFG